MSDNGYPPGYAPPYRLLPYFFGATFGLFFALAGALGCAVAAVNGRQPLWAAIPAAFVVGFVAYSIVGIVLVDDARKARRGHGRRERPDYMRKVTPTQTRIVDPLPIEPAKAERWLRRVAAGDSSLSQAGAEEAAGLDREQANAMIAYLEQHKLWEYANGRDNRNGGDWTPGRGGRFIQMLRPDARYTPLLDALAIAEATVDDEPPYLDDDEA